MTQEISGKNKGHENLIPYKPGQSGNPKGRPKGRRDYATVYKEALIKLAEIDGKSPEDLERLLQETGIRKAIKGNFKFWKDINDRLYGKPDSDEKGDTNIQVNIMNFHGDNDST